MIKLILWWATVAGRIIYRPPQRLSGTLRQAGLQPSRPPCPAPCVLPAHLQAPHSKVPLPSWHLGLPGMPSPWHSHSQMNWRIISTSSVKPRGLILMVSEFLFGHLFAVMLISNWTLKGKQDKLKTKQFKSTKNSSKSYSSYI